ncbi:sialidase family protein [Polyangium aurulentum]|uniref:sialidase family protein n=1 Tax=Polyangium aurulentum TaxID=2567896 RepID=UPI0010AE9290|nr:hypothetical protein [Polyangium aurulentum]UQA60800.1 hypothetical protein E8A73_010095 [Polyangium aurulentum]
MRTLRLLPAALAASVLFAPQSASANGRFPLADQLVVDPSDPSHLVLRTTYGIVQSTNGGSSWSWTCESAVGYGGTQDPAIGVLADGTILAGIFEGLAVSHDRGCSWAFAAAPLESEYTIDVSVHRDDPSQAVAITSTGKGDNGFHVILAETKDNGATWSQAGNAILSDLIALTVDVTPSMPERVYASGLVGKALAPALERTDNRGMSWTRTYLDAAYAKGVPFIAGIDPTNPDRVYLRLSGTTADNTMPLDRLLVSDDGAATFKEVYAGEGDLLGFALSPDGKRVVIGGPKDGIRIADAVDLVFEKVSSVYTRCLTWTAAGLYACGNEFQDGFTVGLSNDEGKTFKPIYHLKDICPLECPAGAKSPEACEQSWPGIAATLGIEPPACGIVGPTTSSASSGGASASSGGGGDEGGCGCRLGSSPREEAVIASIACGLGLGLARRARRRRASR